MMAYSLLVYTCMALAMTPTAIAMQCDMVIDFGNAAPILEIAEEVSAHGKDILKLNNQYVHGPPIAQTTKMAVVEKYVDANAVLQEMKHLKKELKQVAELVYAMAEEMVVENKLAQGKVVAKKTTEYARNIRASKDSPPNIHECDAKTDAISSTFVPNSIKPYKTFGKYGDGRKPSYMLGHRKPNHQFRSQKYHRATERYVASEDKSGGNANFKEYVGKILPKVYTVPLMALEAISPIDMELEDMNKYYYDNARLPASTQDAACNVVKMMRDQRKDNEDPFLLALYMEANDMPSRLSYSNHVQELKAASTENVGDIGMLEASIKNTAFPDTYARPRHLHKNRLARKVTQRKRAQILGAVPGSFYMQINSKPKDKESLPMKKLMLPITYKLRNDPQWKYVNSMQRGLGLDDVQPDGLRALPSVQLYEHEAATYAFEKAINPNGGSQLDYNNMGLESGEINQENFDVTDDKRNSAIQAEPTTETEVKSFKVPVQEMPEFLTNPDIEPKEVAPIIAKKSLQTIIKLKSGENEEQDLEVVCPMHVGENGNAEYGKSIFCSARVFQRVSKRNYRN